MTTALHLARKDLLRLRGALALWLILLPLPAALTVWRASGLGHALSEGSGSLLIIAYMALKIVGLLLVAQLALEDPLHHPDAAWPTRPITRKDLLIAKGTLAALGFVVAPVILLTLVWVAAGFNLADIAALALTQLAGFAVFTGGGLLVGAISRHLNQVLLWLLAACPAFLISALSLYNRVPLTAAGWLMIAISLLIGGVIIAYLRPGSRPLTAALLISGLTAATFGNVQPARILDTATTTPTARHPTISQPLRAGTTIQDDSLRHALVSAEWNPPSAGATERTLQVEWMQLSPGATLTGPRSLKQPLTYLVLRPDGTRVPTEASTWVRTYEIAGIHLTVRRTTVSARDAAATWQPAEHPATPARIP